MKPYVVLIRISGQMNLRTQPMLASGEDGAQLALASVAQQLEEVGSNDEVVGVLQEENIHQLLALFKELNQKV